MTQLVRKYFLFPSGREEWCITGENGSITFWHSTNEDQHYGGVETHYAKPPDYMSNKPPSHEKCPYNNGEPCWHDGTSLWAREHWIPNILPAGDDYIWQKLEQQYLKKFRCEHYCGAAECYIDYDEFHCKFETKSRGKGSI